jgi:hypothetical protein
MPTLKSRLGNPTVNAAAVGVTHDSVDNLQAASATAIPTEVASDGWIDCRSYSLIHATAKSAGANATITAQIKSTADSDAIALTLTDGALTAGTAKIVLDDVIKAGFIRFLAAGTVGGSNTVSLHVILK